MFNIFIEIVALLSIYADQCSDSHTPLARERENMSGSMNRDTKKHPIDSVNV